MRKMHCITKLFVGCYGEKKEKKCACLWGESAGMATNNSMF
jgi:hypothetical protein